MEIFTLANAHGMVLRFIAYGGIIVSLDVPDRHGAVDDVVLGYGHLDDYVQDTRYVGALIGRYANRIARGRFTIDATEHAVTPHEGHHLHGGRLGFHKATWAVTMEKSHEGARAVLTHESPHGDEGYPGTLNVEVTYTVTPASELVVDYRATTDRPTCVNLTQHSYFNLAGHDRGDVLDHQLTVNASRFTPVDADLIPTGELRAVRDTPFDFRRARRIGAGIGIADEQLAHGRGYDHNFVLDRDAAKLGDLVPAARLYEPTSGRSLEISTTEPGVHVYTGNALDARVIGKQWRVYGRHSGVALETQHFPDSPNRPLFPSTVLRPGDVFASRTVYRFGVD